MTNVTGQLRPNTSHPQVTAAPAAARKPLARLISPKSVAIVGASGSDTSFGGRTHNNLLDFDGHLMPVNPRYPELRGMPCYPSLRELPVVPDCVVLAVPKASVEELVRECAHIGAGGVIIFASGYAETGDPEDVAMQQRLKAISEESGMPLIGPNCLGLVNSARGLYASFVPLVRAQGPSSGVGVVSQSGAMGLSLWQGVSRGINLTHMLTAGNSVDTDVADLLDYLVDEPECKVIACQFEGVLSVKKLLQVGERARAARKPIVIHKLARGAKGAAAALSHTGSLAGSDAYYQALFEEAGFIVVQHFEDLIETALFFSKAAAVDDYGLGLLSGSGGAAILASDCAEVHGVEFPAFDEATHAIVEAHLPDFVSVRNPCDMTAQMLNDLPAFALCAEAVLGSAGIGMLIVTQNTAGATLERVPMLEAVVEKTGKPIIIVSMSEWLEGPEARQIEAGSSLAYFRSMDRCMRAVSALKAWQTRLQRAAEPLPAIANEARGNVARMLGESSGRVITESTAKHMLKEYGISVVQDELATSADQAGELATAMGMPVVLKVESADIPHKTEAGAVQLNLRTADQVAAAYDQVMQNARAYAPQADIKGVLVERMVPAGVEVLVGGKVDPLFGPVIVVGLGGIFVELLRDTASAMCPVSPAQALRMFDKLRAKAVLDGFRGAPAVDRERLADMVSRFSQLLSDHCGQIEEFEANPVICHAEDVVAIDALCIRAASAAHQEG